jgi:phage tail-like protein
MSEVEILEATLKRAGEGTSTVDSDLTGVDATTKGEQRLATVAHVADFTHRYPGELVTFFTCVDVQKSLADLTLRVSLPKELELDGHQAPLEMEGIAPHVEVSHGETSPRVNYLVWSFKGQLPAGTRYEYRTRARIAHMGQDASLESLATVTNSEYGILAEETMTVAVWTKGRYLRHLPELYEQDELVARFLMLFESFWAPVETQIDNVRYYFNPGTTPDGFLPWLASWLGLELDERMSIERRRQLIRSAVSLYRRRGTRQALQEHLEIYTGGQVQIVEHRANDFRLGPDARLGPGIALGRGNMPHTFTVILYLPSISPSEGDKDEQARRELARRRAIETIIETGKPAHTAYKLVIREA